MHTDLIYSANAAARCFLTDGRSTTSNSITDMMIKPAEIGWLITSMKADQSPDDIRRDLRKFSSISFREAAVELQTNLRGTLRLSVPTEFGQAWLGRAAAAFMVSHPDVVLEIQTNDGTVDLARDGCDVAIVLRELPSTRMVRKRLVSLHRGLFAAPRYLERHGIPSSLEDLLDHRCLVTDLQRSEKVWTLSQKRKYRRVGPKWDATVANIGLLRELVIGGAGIGMLNDALCQSDLRNGRVVRLLPDWRGPPLTATAVIPSHRMITRRSRSFLDFIHRHVTQPT